MPAVEVDFPRGSITLADDAEPSSKKRKLPQEHAHGAPIKKKRDKKKTDAGEEDETEADVFRGHISLKLLTEGVRGLAAVVEIRDDALILETVNGFKLFAPVKFVSGIYAKNLTTESKTLGEIFTIGQLLAYRVEAQPADRRGNWLVVSTCPKLVNDGLLLQGLHNGMVVNAAVKSVEEKGALFDLGLAESVSFFGPSDVLPELSGLTVGQVMLVRVVRDSGPGQKRLIKVSAFPEVEPYEGDNMTLEDLLPGTVLAATPVYTQASGVTVSFKNGLSAFIRLEHLPPRLRVDVTRCVKPFRVVVTLHNSNKKLIVATAHPDVVAISKISRRLLGEAFTTGETITVTVCHSSNPSDVRFVIPELGDKVSLIAAIMPSKFCLKPETVSKKYYPGSTHQVKVVRYSMFERALVVTDRKELPVGGNAEELEPGQRVTAVVADIVDAGVRVQVGAHKIRATIAASCLFNLPVKTWQKGITVGQKIPCRVLFKNDKNKRYSLTAKPMLVNSKDTIISSYSEDLKGASSVGTITRIHSTGGAILSFYNHVRGFLPQSYVQKLTDPKPGVAIPVQVVSVNEETKRLYLRLPDNLAAAAAVKAPGKPVKLLSIVEGSVIGVLSNSGTDRSTSVHLQLPNGCIGRLHASECLKGGIDAASKCPAAEFVKKNRNRLIQVRVIGLTHVKLPKLKADRVFECSIDPEKLKLTNNKLKAVAYPKDYEIGTEVDVFLVKNGSLGGSRVVMGELTPLTKAVIAAESMKYTLARHVDDYGVRRFVPSESFTPGEQRKGVIAAVLRTKAPKVFVVSLKPKVVPKNPPPLLPGETVVGRITAVSKQPLAAQVSLPGGHTGFITASGVSDYYFVNTKLLEVLRLHATMVFTIVDKIEDAGGYSLAVESRTKPKIDGKKSATKTFKGYVVAKKEEDDSAVVEPYPGMLTTVPDLAEVEIDSLVSFEVDNGVLKATKVEFEPYPDDRSLLEVDNLVEDPANNAESDNEDSEEVDYGSEDENDEEDDFGDEKSVEKPTGLSDELAETLKVLQGGEDPWTAAVASHQAMMATQRDAVAAKKAEAVAKRRAHDRQLSDVMKGDSDEEKGDGEGEEAQILRKEKVLASIAKSNDLCDNVDYDRLVLANPNSAEAWIGYMVFHAQNGNVEESRRIAEKALETIDGREEAEKLNLFTAYFGLEVSEGDDESLKKVFRRATGAFDALEVHKRLANIYLTAKKHEALDKLYNVMVKKFGQHHRDVWGLYASFLYSERRFDDARELMKRALNVVDKKFHLEILSRFASLEYVYGEVERGKTMFEKALAAAPKRGDIWFVYIDKAIKFQSVAEVRAIFERAAETKLGLHTMKSLYQKWQDFEKLKGDPQHLQEVNKRAVQYVKDVKRDIGLEEDDEGEEMDVDEENEAAGDDDEDVEDVEA